MVMEVVSRDSGIEGNVSGSLPARRYLPSPEVMLMANVLSSTEKVRGTSSRFFTMSSSNLEGMAISVMPSTRPDSTSILATRVVSRSVARIVSNPSSKWK